MAPSKAAAAWDDEEDSDSSASSSAPVIARRPGKFDDEEEDGDVLDSWENEEDSEVEREKAKKAAEAKAKAEAEAKANHKSKSQRIEEKRLAALRRKEEEELDASSEEEEDEATKRARLLQEARDSDLKHAEDLFNGAGGVLDKRGEKAVTVQEGDDPANAIDLSSLKLFNPATLPQFNKLRDTLVPLLLNNSKKPQYAVWMLEFTKQICRDLNSEQLKKVASGITTLSNEKLKEEKAADKGGKKTKAAKTKTTLNASRDVANRADTAAYDDDGLDDGDFM